ncbi:YopX family protein [Mediterraneibacter massiliensis]|uniref:YopX family protein n=1 Tax=Mediterraneibacter massiliensis TaxID=1720300 RepID=UPI0022E6E4BF|nr:YopX family protein [Mediterraneibacter massiliensis]
MNREILFKAKRLDNGEWVEGYYTQLPKPSIAVSILTNGELCAEDVSDYIIVNKVKQHNNFSNSFPLEIVECEQYEIAPETLCQFTGLTDKNGKMIWENDIVRYTFDYPSVTATENGLKERISSVFWSEWRGSWAVYADERKGKGMNNDLFKYARNGNTVETIGNIFDNEDLLEVE